MLGGYKNRRNTYTAAQKLAGWVGGTAALAAPIIPAYLVGDRSKSRGSGRSGLSGQGFSNDFKGGAAPLPTKSATAPARRRKQAQKAKKCRNMKGYKLSKEVCSMKNQIRDLKKSEEASLGKMTYRKIQAWNHTVGNNVQSTSSYAVNRPTEYESVLANLKYYDPAVPGTLVTAAAATGTFQKDFLVKNIFSKLSFRNNYQTDVEITAYLCLPKSDSSIGPSTAWGDGISTDAGNVTSKNEIGCFPTDFDVFRDLWTAKRALHKVLSPGQSTECSHSVQDVQYDPALYDEHAADYQRRFKTFTWLVVIKGTLAHDTTLTAEQGIIAAGVDVLQSETWSVQYDAGVNLSYVMLDTTLDTPTNGFVQSHQPIPDNIGFSVA